jgi:hypothetical protein
VCVFVCVLIHNAVEQWSLKYLLLLLLLLSSFFSLEEEEEEEEEEIMMMMKISTKATCLRRSVVITRPLSGHKRTNKDNNNNLIKCKSRSFVSSFISSVINRAQSIKKERKWGRCEKEYLEFQSKESDDDDAKERAILFEKRSLKDNGVVIVKKFGPNWRALRFNEVEQGVSWVSTLHRRSDGNVLAYEYLRTIAAVVVARNEMLRSNSSSSKRVNEENDGVNNKNNNLFVKDRVLNVGLGSGALPFFLETNFGKLSSIKFDVLDLETVEHDEVVLEAVKTCLFDGEEIPFKVTIGDAKEILETKENESLDVITMDAFDGNGNVPEHLISRQFFELCSAKLATTSNESIFVMNCFNGVRDSTAREFVHVICSRLSETIGPVMTIPIHDQPCNIIICSIKKNANDDDYDDDYDPREKYTRKSISNFAQKGFERAKVMEWNAGVRVEGLFYAIDCDEKTKTMREIEPCTEKGARSAATTNNKKQGKYKGRIGTAMPKEFADEFDVYSGQTTDLSK